MKTYTEIAKSTKLSVSHVSRVLRGRSRPSVNTLIKLAWEMGMTAEEFIKRYKLRKRKESDSSV